MSITLKQRVLIDKGIICDLSRGQDKRHLYEGVNNTMNNTSTAANAQGAGTARTKTVSIKEILHLCRATDKTFINVNKRYKQQYRTAYNQARELARYKLTKDGLRLFKAWQHTHTPNAMHRGLELISIIKYNHA